MPENHERHKESDLLDGHDNASENYALPNFASDTASSGLTKLFLPGVTKDTSGREGDNVRTEPLKDVLSHAQQQTEQNETQAVLKVSDDESDNSEDESLAHRGANMDVPSKGELNREMKVINGLYSTVILEKELSLLNQRKSFTQEEDSSRTSHENCSLKQSPTNISIVDQEAADIVYDTLRLLSEVVQLDGEINRRQGSSSGSELQEAQLPNAETSGAEEYSIQDVSGAKEDSLLAAQGISNIRGQSKSDSKDEISSLFHNAPLIFPQESDIAISKQTVSKANKGTSRSPRTTPCVSDVENGITCDTTEITQMGLTDSCKGNQSDNSVINASKRQFHIVVKTHPDGGWGWVVCLGAFLVQFIALGMLNTAGIVYTELVKELKSPRGATAWVGSLATGIMFFLGPLTTSLCERLGCRIVTICGGLICIAGLLLSSLVTSLLPLYLTYGLMFGTGTSLCYFPTIIVLSKYFKRRIAVVNGLVTAGSGVGTLVLGPVVQILFLRFGVPNTFRIVAGIFSLVILCGATFRPVSAKYSQYNDKTKGKARKLFDFSIFKNKGYVIWIASLATFQLGYFVPFVHLVRHAEDLGVSPTDASFLIGYLSVASTVGRLFFGKMADLSCVNRVHMYQLGLFVIGVCSFFVTMATGYGGLAAYAVIFGFFEACYVLLIPLVTSDIVGPVKMSYALGSAFTVMAFPMFLGPPIAGWIYDISGDYAGAFYSCGGISFLAACLMFLVPRMSLQSNQESNQRLPKLLRRSKANHHSELMRVLFGCLWKEKRESRTSSNVQYSGIITTERVENV